eukprot:180826-Hanusia_phi.AAC.3
MGRAQVIAPQDIAIYGGLCALATFDRSELAAKARGENRRPVPVLTLMAQVMEDAAFKQFLELVPDCRELISDFYHSRYSSCLVRSACSSSPSFDLIHSFIRPQALMEKMKGDLMLDMYMNTHVDKLYDMIRSKALVQVRLTSLFSLPLCSGPFLFMLNVGSPHLPPSSLPPSHSSSLLPRVTLS